MSSLVTFGTVRAAGPAAALDAALDADKVQAGPVALLVVVLLALALFLLLRSMNRQLRKVPPSFDDERAAPGPDGAPPAGPQPG